MTARPVVAAAFALALSTAASVPLGAQQPPPSVPAVPAPAEPASAATPGIFDAAVVEAGAQITAFGDEPGRFHRYRDLRDGLSLNLATFQRQRETWAFLGSAERVGYRDQRFAVAFDRFGSIHASFEWTQSPLLLSRAARTLYVAENPGVLRLDDEIQSLVQNRTATFPQFAGRSSPFDLRTRRDIASVRLRYSLSEDLDVRLGFTSNNRSGAQPWGGSFGLSHTVEVPAPTDDRTNELSAAAEWSSERGMLRTGYDGSWFSNQVPALIWDNPIRITDQITTGQTGEGSSQGRMARWPDSTAHAVSVMGAVNLPARTRAHGYVSIGSWIQDQQLLPHTINTAIAAIPLSRPTAEAEARVLSMNWGVNSRPVRDVWLTARVRLYDFDNQTPRFAVGSYGRVDQSVSTSATGGSEPFGYTRNFLDLDASYTRIPHAAIRVGYGREHDDRTYRFFEKTTEHTLRASVDSVGHTWGSARLTLERSTRTGEGLDEEAFSDIGEQVSLRQFDISDRDRTRVTAIGQINPFDFLGLTASVGVGRDERPDARFGLQHFNTRFFTAGIDAAPRDGISFGVEYGFEGYDSLQRSRQANPGPQFEDPTRDWETDADEGVHSFTASIDLPTVAPRTSLRAAYDMSRSKSQYVYVLPPGSTLPAPRQLPAVRNDLQQATLEGRYDLSARSAVALTYWFDHYDVEDFALAPSTVEPLFFPTVTLLGYQWRPYSVHTVSLRVVYRW